MQDIIIQINNFLKKNAWCDFEVIEFKAVLKIGGKTSFENKYDIIIIFEDVYFFQCLTNWKTETNSESFLIPSIVEQRKINIHYQIERGHQLVKILAEDVEGAMYISARKVSVEFLK